MSNVVKEYSVEECVHIWKCIQTRGYKSKEQEKEYKNNIAPSYKKLTGRDLPNFSK